MLDMRSYRGPNGDGRQETYGPAAHFLGPQQVAWLKRELAASRATWKVIAADLPIGVMSFDAAAQGDGPPLGRELEIADLLSFIKHAGVRNTVWITADMHYTAAHYYDPNRAVFQDFEPFWEFMSGPIHAGTGGRACSTTRSARARSTRMRAARSRATISRRASACSSSAMWRSTARAKSMTVTLKDVEDRALWSIELVPQHGIA